MQSWRSLGGILSVLQSKPEAQRLIALPTATWLKSHFVHQAYLFSKCPVVAVSRMIAFLGPRVGLEVASHLRRCVELQCVGCGAELWFRGQRRRSWSPVPSPAARCPIPVVLLVLEHFFLLKSRQYFREPGFVCQRPQPLGLQERAPKCPVLGM